VLRSKLHAEDPYEYFWSDLGTSLAYSAFSPVHIKPQTFVFKGKTAKKAEPPYTI
jgi:hypothetical protein